MQCSGHDPLSTSNRAFGRTCILVGLILGVSGWSISPAAYAQSRDTVFTNRFESGAIALDPRFATVHAGLLDQPTSPTALMLVLDAPVATATFIPVNSSNPSRLAVVGGGVMLAAGSRTAEVRLDALAAEPTPVTLAVSFGNEVSATVRIEQSYNETGAALEADFCLLQFPTALSATAGTDAGLVYGRLFESAVTQVPGAPNGWIAQLGIGPADSDPRQAAGWSYEQAQFNTQVGDDDEFQATLRAQNAQGSYAYTYRFSADGGAGWTYCDADGAGSNDSLTFSPALLGTLTVTDPYAGLVINEVDYDQPGTDSFEFIELYNAGSALSLATLAVVIVDGANEREIARFPLGAAGATLAPGQMLLLHTGSVQVPINVLGLQMSALADTVPNGSPDAIALIDVETRRVLDSISYEGEVVRARLVGFSGTRNLVEGNPFGGADSDTVVRSLIRAFLGSDTNNAAADWSLTTTPTPGSGNLSTP